MLKKIIIACLGLSLAHFSFAETLAQKTERLDKEVKELKTLLYAHKKGWSNPVISSPYLGLRSKFDGSDLITNLPSINEDMRLLMHKYAFHKAFEKNRLAIPEEPIIELSGKLEGIVYGRDPFEGKSSHGINLATAEVDMTIHARRWLTGFIALNYDDAPDFVNRNYATNSRIFLNKGFMTVGDFTQSPFYVSLGQMFIPFGRYSSGQISSPLTAQLARTRVRALNFGFHAPNGLYGQVYAFNGIMTTHEIKTGANLGFEGQFDNSLKGNIAFGILSDVADSNGMQSNGNVVLTTTGLPSTFGGFGKHSLTDVSKLEHSVPAANAHVNVVVGDWTFVGEFVQAIRKFDTKDLVVNNHGAQPNAMHLEAVYGFTLGMFPSHIAVGYEQAHDTLPLLIPDRRYTATLSSSIWRNTIQALEFRHDRMYNSNDTAFGRAFGPSAIAVNNNSSLLSALSSGVAGKSSNTLIFEMGLYF